MNKKIIALFTAILIIVLNYLLTKDVITSTLLVFALILTIIFIMLYDYQKNSFEVTLKN